MKLISQALAEKNLKIRNLPKELQDDISEHKELIIRFNMACEEYEKEEEEDVETEKQLDAQEHTIAENEAELAQRIKNFEIKDDQDEPKPQSSTPVKEEKGTSIGWLIFGGAALLVTLGAVNVFKKR
jgi:cation transport regulator ChaB